MVTAFRQKAQLAASVLVLLAAFWLLISPFVLERPKGSFVATMNVTFGCLILILAYFRILLAHRQAYLSWINVAFGILVTTSPWVMHFPPTPVILWHHIIVGIIVVVLATCSALLSMAQSRTKNGGFPSGTHHASF
jgi:hypothetical protein